MTTRGKTKKKLDYTAGFDTNDNKKQAKLTPELTEAGAGATEDAPDSPEISPAAEEMSDLEMVLREIKEFRRENAESLRGIRDEIKKANSRIDEAERRIVGTEERVQCIESATCEFIKQQKKLEERLIDQEGRARRDNIRLHGVKEGSEDSAGSVQSFVEALLREKLELPPTFALSVERAHRALGAHPPKDAPPRSIIVKLSSYKCKEEIIKKAWEKRGFIYEGQRVYVDHDYAPDVMKKRKEYTEVKRVLKEKKVRFQTPFPARLRVFYEEETRIYNSATEATKDMVARGFQVRIVKPADDPMEKILRQMW